MKKDLKLKIWLFVVFLISYSILEFTYREIFHETIYQQIEVNYKDGGKSYILCSSLDEVQRMTGHFIYEGNNDKDRQFTSEFHNAYEKSGIIYKNVYVIHLGRYKENRHFIGVSKSDIESYDIKTINKSTFYYVSKLINENKIDGKIFKNDFVSCAYVFFWSFFIIVFLLVIFLFFTMLLFDWSDEADKGVPFIMLILSLEFIYFLFKIFSL